MTARKFVLVHDQARRNAASWCMDAPVGYEVRISEPKKRRAQEECYHAMIGDIARQIEHVGRRWHADDMKRILVDEFAEEMRLAGTPLHHDGRVVPSMDGRRIVQLGMQTSEFYVREAAQFIEFLNAFGAMRGVKFTG